MHMLSKKVLSSDEMEISGDPGPLTTVVTDNGEVQTNKDAQVYVRDLHLFVTVQILDDPPAVPFLDKLCEEHGYTWERRFFASWKFRTSCCPWTDVQFW